MSKKSKGEQRKKELERMATRMVSIPTYSPIYDGSGKIVGWIYEGHHLVIRAAPQGWSGRWIDRK